MDQHIIHHARVATLMLCEQMQPEAILEAGKVARALSKFAAFGRAIEEEHLTESEAAELLRNVFRGSRPEEKEV